MKKLLAVFTCLLLLSACADTPPPPVKLETDTSSKINLDVLTVTVIDRSAPSAASSPYTTNNFQPTIASALRHWAMDKLVAVGTTGEAIVVIRDASLTSDSLKHSDSWFTREQASKYTGRAAIDIDVTGREGQGHASAEASRFETLPEEPTARERQNAYTKILNAVMSDVGAKLRSGVNDHLGAFIVTAPVLQ
jgi:hypothetical protein